MKHMLLLSLLFSINAGAMDDNQYNQSMQQVIAVYETIHARSIPCDTEIDLNGADAIASKQCKDFINTVALIDKIDAPCAELFAWANDTNNMLQNTPEFNASNPDKGKEIAKRFDAIVEYCSGHMPSKHKSVLKVMSKIELYQ